jgi:hypothetical protein
VELMMSIAVLAIGISGVIAMQKITVASNRQSKDLAIATQIAQAWQSELALDSVLWNHPSSTNPASDLAETDWLKFVDTGWFRPPFPADITRREFGPAFDGLGNPVLNTNDLPEAHFCAHLRLSWLRPEGDGNGLIRTEVRVFWRREGMQHSALGTPTNAGNVCDDIPADTIATAVERYHFVYLTSAVKQNPLS